MGNTKSALNALKTKTVLLLGETVIFHMVQDFSYFAVFVCPFLTMWFRHLPEYQSGVLNDFHYFFF